MPRLGPKTFEQCAGFLRIRDGDDPLDASGVHPEAYPVVRADPRRPPRATSSALIGNAAIAARSSKPEAFADDTFGAADRHGHPARAGEARSRSAPGVQDRGLQEGVEDIKDLEPGMVLEGMVTNVAAFGAFVDIGVHQDGLVHVSAMSKTFVKDPREVVKPGDIVKVKVLEVDVARKRIALTMRLDDEVGAKSDRAPAQGKPREFSKASMTSSSPKKPQEQGGALAEAMRRAAEKNGRGKAG